MKSNEMTLTFLSKSENETLARNSLASFLTYLDPSLSLINELKTAISETVTNSIIHGYDRREDGIIKMNAKIDDNKITVSIEDEGKGISDVEHAMSGEVKFNEDNTTAGMGFQIIKAFVDVLKVESTYGKGTKVTFERKL